VGVREDEKDQTTADTTEPESPATEAGTEAPRTHEEQ
jgi:hypothetical protein